MEEVLVPNTLVSEAKVCVEMVLTDVALARFIEPSTSIGDLRHEMENAEMEK
jgi:hypothetical protein